MTSGSTRTLFSGPSRFADRVRIRDVLRPPRGEFGAQQIAASDEMCPETGRGIDDTVKPAQPRGVKINVRYLGKNIHGNQSPGPCGTMNHDRRSRLV